MKEKFTPGPWVVDSCHWRGAVPSCCPEWSQTNRSVMARGLSICMVQGDSGKPIEANAHLIAAAPDMYEAGKEMAEAVALLPCDDGRILGLLPILCRLRAALAKADGTE